jgi:hypothetical protein
LNAGLIAPVVCDGKTVGREQRANRATVFSFHVCSAKPALHKKLLSAKSVDVHSRLSGKSDTLSPAEGEPMTENQREIAETVFDRNQRREAEINEALKQEYARREAAVKNMYRLRALRIARDEKAKTAQSSKPSARGHSTANASA